MSKEVAKKFIVELQSNEDLKAKKQGITDIAEIVKLAAEAGYNITMEELVEAEREYKAEIAEKTNHQLSESEIEGVVGGAWWLAEKSSDGREFNCVIFDLSMEDMIKMGEFCKQRHSCVEVNLGGTDEQCDRNYKGNAQPDMNSPGIL